MSALNGVLRDWFTLIGGAVGQELPPLTPHKARREPTRYARDFPAGVNYTSTHAMAGAGTEMPIERILPMLPPVPQGMSLADYANHVGFGSMDGVIAGAGGYKNWRDAIAHKYAIDTGSVAKHAPVREYNNDAQSMGGRAAQYAASVAGKAGLAAIGGVAGMLDGVSASAKDVQDWARDGEAAQWLNQQWLNSMSAQEREQMYTQRGRDALERESAIAQSAVGLAAGGALGDLAVTARGIRAAARASAPITFREAIDKAGVFVRDAVDPMPARQSEVLDMPDWTKQVPVHVRMPRAEVVNNPAHDQFNSMAGFPVAQAASEVSLPAKMRGVGATPSPTVKPKTPTVKDRLMPKVKQPDLDMAKRMPDYRDATRVKAQAETQALLSQLSHSDVQKVNSLLRKKFITAAGNLDKPIATRVTTPGNYMDASAIRKYARKTGDTAEGVRELLRSLHNK